MDFLDPKLPVEQEAKFALRARLFLAFMAFLCLVLSAFLYFDTPIADIRHTLSYLFAFLAFALIISAKAASNKTVLKLQNLFILWP